MHSAPLYAIGEDKTEEDLQDNKTSQRKTRDTKKTTALLHGTETPRLEKTADGKIKIIGMTTTGPRVQEKVNRKLFENYSTELDGNDETAAEDTEDRETEYDDAENKRKETATGDEHSFTNM